MRYQQNGRGLRWLVDPGKVDHTYAAKPVSIADVHLALLDMRVQQANRFRQEGVRRELLEEAAREEPGHPVVAAELARVRGAPLLPALRTAVAARPDDGRGWYLLGLEATAPEEREAALREAAARLPDMALAQAALASQLATTGRAKEGLPLANRALELAPWHPTAVSSLATVALELGQCKQALILQTRAIETVQSKRVGSVGIDLKQLKDRLGEMQKRCPATPAAR
jgi:tetratricopeptide (TPR) repeat protein